MKVYSDVPVDEFLLYKVETNMIYVYDLDNTLSLSTFIINLIQLSNKIMIMPIIQILPLTEEPLDRHCSKKMIEGYPRLVLAR